jgi:hypothetical protein
MERGKERKRHTGKREENEERELSRCVYLPLRFFFSDFLFEFFKRMITTLTKIAIKSTNSSTACPITSRLPNSAFYECRAEKGVSLRKGGE